MEVQRALQFGFGADELERSIDVVRDEVELAFDSRASKQDVQYADELTFHGITRREHEPSSWAHRPERDGIGGDVGFEIHHPDSIFELDNGGQQPAEGCGP